MREKEKAQSCDNAWYQQLTKHPIEFAHSMTANTSFCSNPPASEETLASLKTSAHLPEAYLAFLQRANGGEGFIGERYVQLWRAEELVEANRAYKTAEFFPKLFFVGSDGGGEAYALSLSERDSTVFEVPFVGLPTDARVIASSFEEWVQTPSVDE